MAHGFLSAPLAGVLQIEIIQAHHFCHVASTGRIIPPKAGDQACRQHDWPALILP
jgi:hypothetical protein